MADEPTTQTDDQEISNNVVFSEDEIADIEKEFAADELPEDEGKETDEPTGDEEEEPEGDEEDLDREDEDEDADDDEDPEGGRDLPAGDGKEDEEVPEDDEGFTLVVDGQEIEIDTVDELASLAQKGIFYEKRSSETKRALDNANFTMKAMINDHFGFLEEFYAQKFGDYESARQHVAKLAHAYVVPYYKELQSEPDQQAQLKENRRLQREARMGQGNGAQQQNTFTQEDIEQLQTLEHNVSQALGEVGLPQDSEPLRKRMADIMLGALDRDEYMHPLNAAKVLLRERKELQRELSRTVPPGRKTGKSGKQRTADIAAARSRRSRKKTGTSGSGGGRKVKRDPEYTGRQFIDSINNALGLEP